MDSTLELVNLKLFLEIDNKSNVESHIKTLWSKTPQKVGALQRNSNLSDTQKKYLLFDTITKSHFSNCPLVWVFRSKRLNFSLKYVHERAVRVVYDDHSSSYSELVIAQNEPTIHQYNIRSLMKEMFNFENNLSPPLIDDMLQVRGNTFNLKHFQKIEKNK